MSFAPRVLTALVAPLMAAPVHNQENRFEEQVAFQMSIVESFANSVGCEMTHDLILSSSAEGERETFTVNVRPGFDYRMPALCDEDCSDIDFGPEDMSREELDHDTSLNDHPVVSMTARSDQQVRLRVRICSCSTEPCYFGGAIFGRGTPLRAGPWVLRAGRSRLVRPPPGLTRGCRRGTFEAMNERLLLHHHHHAHHGAPTGAVGMVVHA
jgi:hypothetical protein